MVRTSFVVGAYLALVAQVATAAPACPWNPPKASNESARGIPMPKIFEQYQTRYQRNLRASLPSGECTADSIGVRKSWDEIDDETRLDYIRAVHCLASKPPKTDRALAPGAKNRLDDFTYIHINQTNIIHNSGYLLPWHRIFLNQMETALRDECGYKGRLPYWDNARFSDDQTASKVFDGSMTSFGGNGKYLANDHGPYQLILPGLVVRNLSIPHPAATGGGCVQDGPFKNFTISLGPIAKEVIDYSNEFGYKANPRCLSRNFDPASSKGVLNWANATTIVMSPNISTVRNNIDNLWHFNSHVFVGKEAADPFSPTNDPAFYLLHAQIDRLWAIWQGQDLDDRTYVIDGNRTFMGIPLASAPNVPPSLAQLNDTMDMGLGYKPTAREGMPMTKYGMCYMYE